MNNGVLWIAIHVFFSLTYLFSRWLSLPIVILCGFFSFYLYFSHVGSYDYYIYINYFNSPDEYFEEGFRVVSVFLSDCGLSPYDIHVFFEVSVFLILIYPHVWNGDDRSPRIETDLWLRFGGNAYGNLLAISGIALLSLPFLLGSQNVLRQGIASSILLLGLMLKKRISIKFILILLVAIQFHSASAYTGGALLLVILISSLNRGIFTKSLIAFFAGCGMYLLLNLYFRDAAYAIYQDWGQDRTDIWVKIIAEFFLIFITSKYFHSDEASIVLDANAINEVRILYLFAVIPLAQYAELCSRFLVLSYFIDLYFCFILVRERQFFANRVLLSIIMIGWGFAPSAYNILTASKWGSE